MRRPCLEWSERSRGRATCWFFTLITLMALASCGSLANARGPALSGGSPEGSWSPLQEFDPASVRSLSIDPEDGFRILVLSDIQLKANLFEDPKALAMVRDLVEATAPDLVMTTGDNVAGLFAAGSSRRLAAFMGKLGVPWGLVLGNHDSEGLMGRARLGRLYEGAANSVFSAGPSSIQGVGNYSLAIRDAAGTVVYALVMLDSNAMRKYPDGNRYYDIVHPDQLVWYEWTVKGMSAERGSGSGAVVPSILFFHIPLPEFVEAIAARESRSIDPALVIGEWNELPCPALVNSGLFDAALRLGSTADIIVGHDHVNDISIPWKGIRLTYGRKTGPGSYSRPELQGGTLVTIERRDGGYVARTEHVSLAR